MVKASEMKKLQNYKHLAKEWERSKMQKDEVDGPAIEMAQCVKIFGTKPDNLSEGTVL